MITILQGDALTVLKTLPECSIQCCVTSPPYWGLRDYGVAGQLGLERTPEEYVAKMVEVFREVRRVLREDGTLWLNLGSSYYGAGYSNHANTGGAKREDGGKQKHSYVSGDRSPNPSHESLRALACGSDDTEQSDSPSPDCACFGPCDEFQVGSENRRDRTSHNGPSSEQSPRLDEKTVHDSEHSDQAAVGALPDGAQESTMLSSPENDRDAYDPLAKASASPKESRPSSLDAPLCVDNSCLDFSMFSQYVKAKGMIPIPWMVAMALQKDGWWLRQDIIWDKVNPMPESVQDRCCKSHEYIFLLTKSARYFFDQEAIKEPCSQSTHARISQNLAAQVGSFRANGGNKTNGPMKAVIAGSTRKIAEAGSSIAANESYDAARALVVSTRTKRSVWRVTTQGYSEAHFATFPPDLIKPCILAGSKPGDTILDPFGGSGTTGMVALELGRKAILIELNESYCELARTRCQVTPGLPLA